MTNGNPMREPKERKKRKRGSVRNDTRLEAFTGRRKASAADWAECDSDKIQAIIVGVTELGGAAIFGMSRDQGAHSVTLLLDGQKASLWFNGDAALDDELQSVIDTLKAIT